MNGTIVNALAIAFGALIGLNLKHRFLDEKAPAMMVLLGLSVLLIGVQGVLNYSKILALILSSMFGFILGETLKIEDHMLAVAQKIETRFESLGQNSFVPGFVSSSLLFGVGAMAILGSIESGLNGNETILYTKSLLDFISSIVLASTLGVGVFFSSVVILLYQGSLTVLSSFLAQYLTPQLIEDMSAIGSLLIMALGFNLMQITHIKIANLLPAIVVMILLSSLGFSI